jgi:SAM-dependent methyltransferase
MGLAMCIETHALFPAALPDNSKEGAYLGFVEPGEDPVKEQYERWPYPPESDNPGVFARYLKLYEVLGNFTHRFWPAGKPRENLQILVAGCGTLAAACYAYNYPRCQVVGIDLSRASLEQEQKLKEQHRLQNLTLEQCSIEDAAKLGGCYDFISCQGVLHHTEKPAEALRVLGGMLSREGIISLALYGKYPRGPVYPFQELFRLLGLDQSPESVAVVRETLAVLPADHPLQSYLRHAVDQQTDVGLVDTFLHARDRAYSVSDCLALVAEAGLVFQGWDMNFGYHPDGSLCGNPRLRERIAALTEEQTWQAMETVSGSMRMHEFHVCRADRDPATYRVPWDSERLLECVPGHCVDLLRIGGTPENPLWAMGRGALRAVPLTPTQAVLFSKIDGRRNVREVLAAAGATGPDEALLATVQPLLRLLWRTGYGVFCLPRWRS